MTEIMLDEPKGLDEILKEGHCEVGGPSEWGHSFWGRALRCYYDGLMTKLEGFPPARSDALIIGILLHALLELWAKSLAGVTRSSGNPVEVVKGWASEQLRKGRDFWAEKLYICAGEAEYLAREYLAHWAKTIELAPRTLDDILSGYSGSPILIEEVVSSVHPFPLTCRFDRVYQVEDPDGKPIIVALDHKTVGDPSLSWLHSYWQDPQLLAMFHVWNSTCEARGVPRMEAVVIDAIEKPSSYKSMPRFSRHSFPIRPDRVSLWVKSTAPYAGQFLRYYKSFTKSQEGLIWEKAPMNFSSCFTKRYRECERLQDCLLLSDMSVYRAAGHEEEIYALACAIGVFSEEELNAICYNTCGVGYADLNQEQAEAVIAYLKKVEAEEEESPEIELEESSKDLTLFHELIAEIKPLISANADQLGFVAWLEKEPSVTDLQPYVHSFSGQGSRLSEITRQDRLLLEFARVILECVKPPSSVSGPKVEAEPPPPPAEPVSPPEPAESPSLPEASAGSGEKKGDTRSAQIAVLPGYRYEVTKTYYTLLADELELGEWAIVSGVVGKATDEYRDENRIFIAEDLIPVGVHKESTVQLIDVKAIPPDKTPEEEIKGQLEGGSGAEAETQVLRKLGETMTVSGTVSIYFGGVFNTVSAKDREAILEIVREQSAWVSVLAGRKSKKLRVFGPGEDGSPTELKTSDIGQVHWNQIGRLTEDAWAKGN